MFPVSLASSFHNKSLIINVQRQQRKIWKECSLITADRKKIKIRSCWGSFIRSFWVSLNSRKSKGKEIVASRWKDGRAALVCLLSRILVCWHDIICRIPTPARRLHFFLRSSRIKLTLLVSLYIFLDIFIVLTRHVIFSLNFFMTVVHH